MLYVLGGQFSAEFLVSFERKKQTPKVNKELFFDLMMNRLPSVLKANSNHVYLSTTPQDAIISDMWTVMHNDKNAAQVFNKLLGTINESNTISTTNDLSGLFHRQDYSGRDFSNINLSGLQVYSTNFTGANLSSANFADAAVTNCNFTNANLKFSNFTVSTFITNTVENCDFDGASIAKDIQWDKQSGTAKNVTVSNITYGKKGLSRVLESTQVESPSKAQILL